MKSRVASPAFWASLVALAGITVAMLLYRGGNPLNEGISYHFTENFLSDLGITSTYNHTSQPLVITFFAIGLFAASVATWSWYRSAEKATRSLAILAACFLILVPLIPSDLFFWPHRIVVLAALISLALANIRFLTRGGIQGHSYQLALSIFQVAYLIFVFIGPMPAEARVLHVILQKIAIYSQLALYICCNAPLGNKKTTEVR
ncbi:hypothetical protein BH11PAT4_BH11PAT4_2610 [soil metagenome]